MATEPRNPLLRYGLAVAFVLAAVAVRLLLLDAIGGAAPYALLYPAVLLAALYGGWGPGLLATLLALALADYYWVAPLYSLGGGDIETVLGQAVFLVTSATLVTLVLLMQRARAKLQELDHERRQRESSERLRRTELRYRALFDSVDQGACVCEMVVDAAGAPIDYRFVEVNELFGAMTGLVGEVVGRTARELVPGLESHWITSYARVGLGRETLRFEAGSAIMGREFNVLAAPVEPHGAFFVLFTDVSERKASERRLQRVAALDAFRVALLSRLRPLSDPVEVQQAAVELLRDHLDASRVAYFAVSAGHYVVERDTVRDVPSIVGRHPIDAYGSTLLQSLRAGQSVCSEDLQADAGFSAAERAAYAVLGVQAHFSVPLIKAGELVAGLTVHWASPRQIDADERIAVEETAELTWAAVERAHSDAALRQSEQEFRTLGEALPDFLWLDDARGTPLYMNPAWSRYTGLPLARLLQDGWSQVMHPDELPQLERGWQQTLRDARPATAEFRARHRDGGYRWFQARTAPVRDDAGQVTRWVGAATDIHESKLAGERVAQAAAREQERADELAVILRSIPVGVWIAHDPECRVVTSNDYGHTLMQTQGRSSVSLLDAPQDLGLRFLRGGTEIAPGELPMQRSARRGEPEPPEEIELLYRDGSRRTLLCSAVPLKDAQGALLCVIGVGIDLSERKAMEQALHEADQRKDEFLAVLAHELRNPLAPIRNAIALLKLNPQAAPAPTLLAMLERQVGHMVRLVDDLMEVSRIQRGTIDLQRERLDLARVIHSAVETSRPGIDAAGHALRVDLGHEPVHVTGDAVRLSQVVANLLNNAARYTDPGGRISLRLAREGAFAVVEVADSGIGIAPEQIGRMFTMFGQVDPAAWRSQGGMGIGLALAQRIAGLHGGSIAAHSEGLGQGSRFTVRLPLADAAGEAPPPSVPADAQRLAARRVLVVDDHRDAADSLGLVLAARGAQVRVAHDGPEALAVLAHWPAQALVLDLGMPGIDGHELARRVRAQPLHRQSILIAVSGWGQERDRRASKASGFDHHLTKPVDTAALEALIASVPAEPTPTLPVLSAWQETPDAQA